MAYEQGRAVHQSFCANVTKLSAKAAAVLTAIYGTPTVQAGDLTPLGPEIGSSVIRSFDYKLAAGVHEAVATSTATSEWRTDAAAVVNVPGTSSMLRLDGSSQTWISTAFLGYDGIGGGVALSTRHSLTLSGSDSSAFTSAISVTTSSGSTPGETATGLDIPASSNFLRYRVDPILAERVGDATSLTLQKWFSSGTYNILGSQQSSGGGFAFGRSLTAQLRINGVDQQVSASPDYVQATYDLHIGDIIELRMQHTMTLTASGTRIDPSTLTPVTGTQATTTQIWLAGCPGISPDNPLRNTGTLPTGESAYEDLRILHTWHYGPAVWLTAPEGDACRFSISEDAPDLTELRLYNSSPDSDGFRLLARTADGWNLVGTISNWKSVLLPAGTREVAFEDIELPGNFVVGLYFATPADAVTIYANPSAVPEPGAALAVAALGILGLRRRRR